ncbi:hypothetical protein ACQYHE_005498, partial [Escherichia coli]
QDSKKIMGVFLLWLPEHLQSPELLSVPAISPECLMAHSALRSQWILTTTPENIPAFFLFWK